MVYRLLCCSDTHGRGAPSFQGALTAWIHAGDFYSGWRLREERERDEVDPESEPQRDRSRDGFDWFPDANVPAFAVRGNHDVTDPYGFFGAVEDITGRVLAVAEGVWVAGVGCHGQYFFDVPLESDLEAICERVRRELRRKVRLKDRVILVSYYPAMVTNGPSYQSVKQLAEEIRPLVVVQGHVHESFGRRTIVDLGGSNSLVIDPGPAGMVLSIDGERWTVEVEDAHE